MVVILLEEKDQGILGVTDDDIFVSHDPDGRGSGLSIGAKVGASIGASTAFSLLLFLVIWLIRSRVRARREAQWFKNQPYELSGVRRRVQCTRSICDSEEAIETIPPHVVAAPRLETIDPPPAYEAASPSQVSLERVGTATRNPEDELRALKAEQEYIQRRIEVLEREVIVGGVGSRERREGEVDAI
jgi:hypothetical protein